MVENPSDDGGGGGGAYIWNSKLITNKRNNWEIEREKKEKKRVINCILINNKLLRDNIFYFTYFVVI